MPVNFPSNPSLNQTYTFTNTTWKWNGIGWEIVYNTRQTGATGATGISGAPGSPGGATGATGPAGPAGSPGGATGATGPAGTPGTIGIDGATGATGPQGPSGSPGSPGGATGATGAQGATGSPGTPGGATGATGAPGPAGSGANVAVRDEGNLVVAAVSSLNFVGAGVAATATGSNVTITISATGNSQFYYTNVAPTNATIGDRWLDSETLKEFVYADVGTGPQWIEPAGDGGFVGATGPTGAAGSQGATGATGIGATGATGTAGVQGATGTAGTPGSPGTAGATGATGTAGTPGTAGATGATGTAGTPGSAGSPGTAGATGATGTAGTPGTAGATGATGIGATGATGAQGATGPAGTSANISVFDEGNLVTASVSGINFVGPGITANLVSGNVQVSVTATGTGTGGFNFSNAAPATPTVGDRWLNSETLTQYVYINDGDSSQWVEPITRAASSNLTNVSTHILPDSNVTYDLGSSSLRWRDLYLSGNSIILGGATLTASGSAIALPAGSTVGGQNLATGSDVSTGGGPKITNLQVTSNVYVVLDDTAVDTVGGFIKLTGTNFVTGCMVYVGTVPANSTTFVNSTEVRAQLPATAAGTYPVYVVNPDGGTAIRVPGVTFSASPAWQTASNLGEQYDGVLLNLSVVATDATSYTLVSGSLPPGLSLNSNTGVISGTVTGVTNDTVYSFTINAVDPQLQDSPRTFTVTITVSDPYFKLTTLLLSGSAVSANTVVRDSSTNNFNLTVYGDARASNFTPYGTGWSNLFNSNRLNIATTGFAPGTGNFTVEAWIYPTSYNSSSTVFTVTTTGGLWLGKLNSNWVLRAYNVADQLTTTTLPTLNTWTHVAWVRNGSTATIYFNGNSVVSGTVTYNFVSGSLAIGDDGGGTSYFLGYVSNLRYTTTAVYTANFTPATTNLTSITGTQLLTCQDNRFRDTSANAYTITTTGTPTVSSFNPFNITNTGVNGSMYFDGTGDYVTAPSNAAFGPSGDFTFESWLYWTGGSNENTLFCVDVTGGINIGLAFGTGGANWGIGRRAIAVDNEFGTAPIKFTWNHLAVSRQSGTIRAFVNGRLVFSGANTVSYVAGPPGIACIATASTNILQGYISDARFVSAAVYTANFTPTTSSLTAIANTQLLTLQYDQPHNNHTFLDSSSTQHLITRSGNASQGTFSPFSQTGWSNYFDGSGDYLSISNNIGFDLSSSDFTVEAWVYRTGDSGAYTEWIIGKRSISSGDGYLWSWSLGIGSSNYASFGNYNGAVTGTTAINFNTWYHIAVTRISGAYKLYVNGLLEGTNAGFAIPEVNVSLTIGNYPVDNPTFTGYISNIRVIKGNGLYTANFTPATNTLTAVANTSLLTCHANRFMDASTNNFTIAKNGDARVVAFSPFAATAVYSPITHGASVYFDGSGDFLTFPDHPALELGNRDFTVECWVYRLSTDSHHGILSKWSSPSYPFMLWIKATNVVGISINNSLDVSTTATISTGTWNHIAVTRNANVFTIWLNGVSAATATSSITMTDTSQQWSLGRNEDTNTYHFNGYISGFRVVAGIAVYTSAFTPPTAPPTSTANTQLLLNFTDAAIFDSTGRNVLETAADAKTSSVVTKFTGGSMSFDGTGDWLEVKNKDNQAFNFGSGNFTIEGWYNVPNASTQYALVGKGPSDADDELLILLNNGTYYIDWGGGQLYMQGGSYTANAWHHFALVRLGTDFRLYHNGNSAVSATLTAGYSFTNNYTLKIGSGRGGSYAFNGYINDLRITQGYARYTANFTTPTIPARLK